MATAVDLAQVTYMAPDLEEDGGLPHCLRYDEVRGER